MHIARRAPAGALVASLAFLVLLAVAAPASAVVKINETESDGAADFIELMNVSAGVEDISGYVVGDSEGNSYTIPAGTTIAANGFHTINTPFGLGKTDSARLSDTGGTQIDIYSWTEHALFTYGRCPDGTGEFVSTLSATPNAANDCPVVASPWPGGSAISTIADPFLFGENLSGLAYQPSGTSARGVLWAVKNGPSMLYRLIHDGTKWKPDPANGWGAGKQMLDTAGGGVPDAESVTLVAGDTTGIYVSVERNATGGAAPSRPAVVRYDITTTTSDPLQATREWNLTADLPGLDGNAGLEAITWIPDDVLVAKGFVNDAAATYNPANYPNHGTGLFFVGVEQDGKIIAYALNQSSGDFTRVATIPSGFLKIMGLEYEPETKLLWAACDNECDGRTATLDVAQSGADDGKFVVTKTYARPGGMPNLNNEGFAIAPQAECVGGFKPVFWADDSSTDGHALRGGTIKCTVIKTDTKTDDPVVPKPDNGTPKTVVTTPPAMIPVVPPPALPLALPDRAAPGLTLALKLPKALRRTGRFSLVVTLSEPATLTLTGTARKGARGRARQLLRTTKSGVAGTRAVALSLPSRVRKALRKGETITLSVVARDAAGNTTTRRATAKVR